MKEENIENIKLKDATLEQLFDEIESRDDTVKFTVEGEYGPDEEPPDGYVSLDEMVGGRAIIYVPDSDLTIATRNRFGIAQLPLK